MESSREKKVGKSAHHDFDIDIFVNCNWVATRWQQYSTHLHTNNTQNNTMKQNIQNEIHITIIIHNLQN
jgi:hypothetical protein